MVTVHARVVAFDPEAMQPGDVAMASERDGRPAALAIACPGCGGISAITIRPADRAGASWDLSGWPDAPTLAPSIIHGCGWHGWLSLGEWRPC